MTDYSLGRAGGREAELKRRLPTPNPVAVNSTLTHTHTHKHDVAGMRRNELIQGRLWLAFITRVPVHTRVLHHVCTGINMHPKHRERSASPSPMRSAPTHLHRAPTSCTCTDIVLVHVKTARTRCEVPPRTLGSQDKLCSRLLISSPPTSSSPHSLIAFLKSLIMWGSVCVCVCVCVCACVYSTVARMFKPVISAL